MIEVGSLGLLQGDDGLDGCDEDIQIVARDAVEAVGGGEVLDNLELLIDVLAAILDY